MCHIFIQIIQILNRVTDCVLLLKTTTPFLNKKKTIRKAKN